MAELEVCQNCDGFIYRDQEAAMVGAVSGFGPELYVHADPEECEDYDDD